jgi:hypothetical protein
MSQVVSIPTQVHDPHAVASACQRLGLPMPVHGTAELFSGEATGLIVHLPGWHYPVVVDTLTGVIRYNNFQGYWGEQQHLDRFLQIYATEKAKLACRQEGHAVSEQALQGDSSTVRIIEGGA